MYRRIRSLVLPVVACVFAAGSVPPPPLVAQTQSGAPVEPADSSLAPANKASTEWFSRREAVVASAFALGTVALFPFDSRIAKQFQNPGAQSNRLLGRTAEGFELVASPGSYWIGGTLYAVGLATRRPRVADLGLHGTEAILLATVAHNVLKGIAGRARPYVSNDSNPADFSLFRGFGGSDYRAFPSGHASTAFAAASAVTAEVSRWRPKYTPYVGTVMYGGAAMVALSRMYSDKHWASDVVLGAAIGTFSGWKVVQFHHREGGARNRIDRALLSASVIPDGQGGFAIGWTLPALN